MHDNRSEYQSREYKRYPDQKPDIGLANGINSAVEKARADVEREALQRHHDYYIELKRQGKLTETDRLQYDLAKEREKQGLVYKSDLAWWQRVIWGILHNAFIAGMFLWMQAINIDSDIVGLLIILIVAAFVVGNLLVIFYSERNGTHK